VARTLRAIDSAGRWLEASAEVSARVFSLITGSFCGKRLYHLLNNFITQNFIYLCKATHWNEILQERTHSKETLYHQQKTINRNIKAAFQILLNYLILKFCLQNYVLEK